MTRRAIKGLYYALLSVPMRLNGQIYKHLRQSRTPIKVHLGCGPRNYIPGWINVDANFVTAKIDLWIDLKQGLPFRDNSVERFYSFHVIEHLPDTFLAIHFQQMYRALVPGGAIRVGGPNIDNACKKLLQNDLHWFSEFPDARASVGGRFASLVFCRNEHLTALSKSYLEEVALSAGFTDLHFCLPVKESVYFDDDVRRFEYENDYVDPHSILIEARKPMTVRKTASTISEAVE